MKPLLTALLLAWVAMPATAADVPAGTLVGSHALHPFDVGDLVMMDRVSDPQISPDGRYATFSLRSTDYAANKGVNAIYVQDLESTGSTPIEMAARGASFHRWAADDRGLYYVAAADGVAQLWRLDFSVGKKGIDLSSVAHPVQVSHGPLDINNFKLSPDGKSVLLSYVVFTDCSDLACTKERLDGRAKDKTSGTVYQKLFVRHWDTWSDGRRSQLYIARFGADGVLPVEPTLLTRGIDGDVPSKPFGDESEFAFSPDVSTVYFDVRIAGNSEP
jgi:dipeptidyl aminopeptidase/acylaminoacyl peptidase